MHEPRGTSTQGIERLLHRLGSWPYVAVERGMDSALLHARDLVVGTLDLAGGSVWVDVLPYAAEPEVERHPALRRTSRGIGVHVDDGASRAVAEELVRWRVGLERFAPQLGAASP
jgi:hypothetical protein